jgi:hypothetical protein
VRFAAQHRPDRVLGNARDADLFSAREDARPPSQGFVSPIRPIALRRIAHSLTIDRGQEY